MGAGAEQLLAAGEIGVGFPTRYSGSIRYSRYGRFGPRYASLVRYAYLIGE